MRVYIAHLEGTKYMVFGVGKTEAEAKAAVGNEYRRTNNSGYGFTTRFGDHVETDEQIDDYFGINVYGPVSVPGAVTQ
jgi:hypothetical protein